MSDIASGNLDDRAKSEVSDDRAKSGVPGAPTKPAHRRRPLRHQIQALANDRLHLGFAKFLVTHTPAGVEGQPASQHRMWAILPEGHPKICRKRPIALISLANESFIFVSASEFSGYFQWIQNECIKAGFTPRIVRTTEHPQNALDLVCAGLGVSLL